MIINLTRVTNCMSLYQSIIYQETKVAIVTLKMRMIYNNRSLSLVSYLSISKENLLTNNERDCISYIIYNEMKIPRPMVNMFV